MFNNLTNRLTQVFKVLTGQSRFTEENTQEVLKEIRLSLLEADVALPVISLFIEDIKEKILGQSIETHLKPEQALIKIVNDELIHVLGDKKAELNFKTQPPAVFLMAGLQGSGKTTTSAKLARYLKEIENKKVMLVSVDIYRPAAIEQLELLAHQIEVEFFPGHSGEKPLDIAANAIDNAKKKAIDVIIFDTAGRLHIDTEMMTEIKSLHQTIKPIETLFVVDSMTGQDAAITAKAFHDVVPLTGIILTKTDGDARGGAALSVKQITNQPIKFLGIGEKIDVLEVFHPERIASRILGMGDILTLIEEIQQKTDTHAKKEQEKLANKIKKGKGFDLEDYKQQLLQMNKMGGVASLMQKLPGLNQIPQQAMNQVNDKMLNKTIAIINSMTPRERRIPKIIIGSRKKRIALGSGTQIQEVNRLLKQYEQMQKMMSKLTKPGGLKQLMRGMGQLPGLKNLFPDQFEE